ncbi:isocitrate/isopropylmalate family dehydrogenase [Aliiroseovarius sp. S1339]|uniref:isocitrate/isopropylmalate dehydrogenase family protein n=1 Tax=Aliiroseovarius sp. S1339 TaxID=2936990 RepID=UPI0020BF9BA4|nr:isocitrate/isopropylmalate family dehydrogenase [Aliiroseovarius sp. S1339]MCK8463295.1 isocitrate/isopropylmalate family dehydrogenase [Aliiroseovarius sp. S1339]
MTTKIQATLIPGDGIGPEITKAVTAILDHMGNPFEWDVQHAGLSGIDASGDPLPQATIDSIRRTKLALKGPLTTPVGGGFKSINLQLRQEFELFANVRPTKTIKTDGRYDNIDMVIFRENLEGYYIADEGYMEHNGDPKGKVYSTGYNTKDEARRITRAAFDYAVANGRKKVSIVHKANILKLLSGMFLEEAREVAKEYEGRVEVDERIVDACAMQMVMYPEAFDVIVTTNLFGDILSDLAAGLVGGLGLAPGANIGEDAAIFEAVHGSAPDIAGQQKANPCAFLMAAGLMLEHVGLNADADRLKKAVIDTVQAKDRVTPDLGGTGNTMSIAEAIMDRL